MTPESLPAAPLVPPVFGPQDTNRLPSFVSQPGEGRSLEIRAGAVIVREDGSRTLGSLGIFEQKMSGEHTGPVPHYHAKMVEIFVVLSGCLIVTVDDVTTRVQAGGVAMVFPGSVHWFQADPDEGAHFLIMFSPAAERVDFFEGLAAARQTGGAFDPQTLMTFMTTHDQFVVDASDIKARY
jgi:mannose-6-phosphate isomerase-like protein (cupin superfamily)